MDERPEYEIARETVERIARECGLEIKAQFVPLSQSRNGKPAGGRNKPWESLNWRISLTANGRPVLECDYSQGSGHTPAYKSKSKAFGAAPGIGRMGALRSIAIAHECETGRVARLGMGGNVYSGKAIAAPEIGDVLGSLAMDGDALDYAGFEDWAESLGYDADSRQAESTYRLCLSHALALRAAIGDSAFAALREAAAQL